MAAVLLSLRVSAVLLRLQVLPALGYKSCLEARSAVPDEKKNGRLEKAGGDSGDDEDSGDEDEEDDDNDGDDDDD